MKTRNIFLDTSIFVGHNYSYQSSAFKRLTQLATSKQANVLLTDITIREVKWHIKADASRAVQAAAKFRQQARLLRNIGKVPFLQLFVGFDEATVIDELDKQLATFVKLTGATVLQTSAVSVDVVFDKYFRQRPPFGDGRKKSEFPDAFALEALENWSQERHEKAYVVTSDPDMRRHCESSERLFVLHQLAEYIDLVEFYDEVLAPSVRELLESNKDAVEKELVESFCDQGFWLADQEGEVEVVKVNSLEVIDILLLEVDNARAVIQVEVKVDFAAHVTYADLDTAIYDSEDKVVIPLHTIDKTIDREAEFVATVHVLHNAGKPGHFEVEHLQIEGEDSNGFAVSIDDEWPYK